MPAEKVTTVLGGISPEALGFCQMHEHIMLRKGVPALLDPALMADDIEKSTQELHSQSAADVWRQSLPRLLAVPVLQ